MPVKKKSNNFFHYCGFFKASELEDLLEDLQNGGQQQQQHLFPSQPPSSSSSSSSSTGPPSSSVDKQTIISDILQLSDRSSSPSQHRTFPAVGPAGTVATGRSISESYLSCREPVKFAPRDKTRTKRSFFFPAGFNGARPDHPGQGAPPVRSMSLDSSMGSSPTRPFPHHHRNNGPYSLLQQQGMMGTHPGMTSQAGVVNAGKILRRAFSH